MNTTGVDPPHTLWALAPWDPESISFGPFRNPILVSPIIADSFTIRQVKYVFSLLTFTHFTLFSLSPAQAPLLPLSSILSRHDSKLFVSP